MRLPCEAHRKHLNQTMDKVQTRTRILKQPPFPRLERSADQQSAGPKPIFRALSFNLKHNQCWGESAYPTREILLGMANKSS